MAASDALDLVLASTSPYRAELLRRLGLPFRQMAPDVDETRLPDELPEALAHRLALAKARAAALRCNGAVVIGSDQVASLGDRVLGKPGSIERAHQQLAACSGREVVFRTAISVIDTRDDGARVQSHIDLTRVRFRELAAADIERYVQREQPLDCAGSFKVEGLGIALFDAVENSDPSGLIGLPLIAVCRMLRNLGIGCL